MKKVGYVCWSCPVLSQHLPFIICHNLVLFFDFCFVFLWRFIDFNFIFHLSMSHVFFPHFVSFFLFLLHHLINSTIITPKKKTPPFKSTIQLAEWPWPHQKLKQNPKNPTHQPEPSGPPQEVKCYSSSSTSILVRWRPPPIESQNGIITQYTIQYAVTEGEDTGTQQIHGISPQSSQYLLENLDKWTEYRVTVMAHTDVGAGPESLPQLIRTEEDGMCLLKPQLQINFTLPPLNIQILTTATSSFSLPPTCC